MKYALGNMLNGAGGLNPDGLALDLQFAADKTLTARKGPTPVFTRGSGNNGGTTYFGPLIDVAGENTAWTATAITNGRAQWSKPAPGVNRLAFYTGTQWKVEITYPDAVYEYFAAVGNEWRPDQANWSGSGISVTTSSTYGIVRAANNEPRFDHDPVTLASRGLLIEESRTNLLNGSQTFATSGGSQNNWVDTNITRDGTLRTSPDGTANALRIAASAANGTIISSAAAGSSAARVFSIFLRRVTGTGDIQYTLDNGSTWTTQSITGSWVRYTFAATTANQQVGIRIVTSGDAIEIWGAQLEAGPFATSYIPTTTGTLARAADVCSITGAAFSGMWNASEGSAFFNGISAGRGSGAFGNAAMFLDIASFTDNRLTQFALGGGIVPDFKTNNIIQYAPPAITYGNNTVARQSIGFRAGETSSAFFNNTAFSGGTNIALTMPTVNGLYIGSSSLPSNFVNGTISAIRYYKKRLSNAKLQALTA